VASETSSSRRKGALDPAPERASWKDRYAALEARLAAMKAAFEQTRLALRASQERDQATRATLAKVRERLHRHERALLRPEVVADLMPTRAQWRRQTAPDEITRQREARHRTLSDSYSEAHDVMAPAGVDRVDVGGITWYVPRDARVEGRLADRLVREKRLPLVDLLRTREAVSNGTMLDVGANIGLTSVTRAVLGDAELVYAAEPAPDNFACLVRTIVDNGLSGIVLPDRVAISDRDGTATLRLSESIGGHALIAGVEGVTVSTMWLDSWVRKLDIDVHAVRYVKMDTQGHEAHVLDGAADLLTRPGVVWELEFSPRHLQSEGREPESLIAHLQAVFTHFIDLNPYAPGDRLRPVAELREALSYLKEHAYTNLLVYQRRA